MTRRCADCGEPAGLAARRPSLRTCRCGAACCTTCLACYHSKEPRLGCAAYAGKKLAEDFTRFQSTQR